MIRLFHGNCLDILSKGSDNSIDLTVTSPPYDNLRAYNDNNSLWNENVWKSAIKQLYRITKVGGVIVWIVQDATIKGSKTGTSFKQALYAMNCGFRFHDTMVWNKDSFTAVGSLSVRYAPVFEYMFIFSKGKPKTFNPIKDRRTVNAGKKQSVRIQWDYDKAKRKVTETEITPEYGQRFNIWNQSKNSNNKTGHPATFPIQLAGDHIISWSNKGDTVLDPFMGSGTTGVACKNLNRSFIGIELDKKYFEIAKKRIGKK